MYSLIVSCFSLVWYNLSMLKTYIQHTYKGDATWPFPNRPCVSTMVTTRSRPRSISKYSYVSLETGCLGHHAPPLLSVLILKVEKFSRNYFYVTCNENVSSLEKNSFDSD